MIIEESILTDIIKTREDNADKRYAAYVVPNVQVFSGRLRDIVLKRYRLFIIDRDSAHRDWYKTAGCDLSDLYLYEVVESEPCVVYLKSRLRCRSHGFIAIHHYQEVGRGK